MPRALITGITGQDGSFLAEQLLARGWEVVGMIRRTASPSTWRIGHILGDIQLVHGDVMDLSSLLRILSDVAPDHVYNLAAQSAVSQSWTQPLLTSEVTAMGCARVLEAVRLARPQARFYQASSSEMFGLSKEPLQSETTPFHPRSPYGVAKTFAHHMTVNYRESHGLFAVSGILFNHESERRGLDFVTRKIAAGAVRIRSGDTRPLQLGSLYARRDWGFAGDYTQAMIQMLTQDQPEDFVIATGQCWSVAEFAQRAFDCVNLSWEDHVVQDEALVRPAEIPALCGDASKAREGLKWKPSLSFDGLVERMVRGEVAAARAR